MNLFGWFFLPFKKETKTSKEVTVGEIWHNKIDDDGNPFKQRRWSVKVLEVRDGWIRYYINDVFPNCHHPIDTFTKLYTRN